MPMKSITFCRVARCATDKETSKEFQFTVNNVLWQAETFLHDEFREFLDTVNAIRASKTPDISFETQHNGQDLIITTNQQITKNRIKYRNYALHQLMPFLFNNYIPELSESDTDQGNHLNKQETAHLIRTYITTQLYDVLYNRHLDEQRHLLSPDLVPLTLPACFLPKLCHFQEITVRWLLQREQQRETLPCMYEKLFAKDNINVIYKHRWCIDFKIEGVPMKTIALPPGGILAEEMGLGKTVEVLALILLHKPSELITHSAVAQQHERPSKMLKLSDEQFYCICSGKRGKDNLVRCTKCALQQHIKCVTRYDNEHPKDINEPYYCPSCWAELTKNELIESAATFIVTPNIIKNQWVSEVYRHIRPGLKVFVYNSGVSKNNWISPRQLANYDIVLTDYTVLRSEFYHADVSKSDRKTRNKPITMYAMTPLLMLKWWRVCLDEAQMVESNTTQVATLVRKLPAVNRWAVTGTPIQQSIDDLLPLFRFVGIPEFCEPLEAWNNLVRDFITYNGSPNRRYPLIDDVLSKCMWRTCKARVEDELKLPPQTIRVHRIELSDIEMFHYEQQHKQCQEKFNEAVLKHLPFHYDGATISPQVMKLILQPVLKIRQCCSVSVVQTSVSGPIKQFLQPKELHAHLKSVNDLECKFHLRAMASSYNGIAGVHILYEQYDDAIRNYLEVIQLAQRFTEYNFSVDSLLQIHALHNLLQANAARKSTLLTTTQIENYQKQLNALEWKYIEGYSYTLQTAKDAYEELEKECNQLKETVQTDFSSFLNYATAAIIDSNPDTQFGLFSKIITECQKHGIPYHKIKRFHYLDDILETLRTWSDNMAYAKLTLMNGFESLRYFTENVRISSEIDADIWKQMRTFISSVYECHLINTRINQDDDGIKLALYKQQKDIRRDKLCKLCLMKQEQARYECLLFNKQYNQLTNQNDGMDNPSMEISLLKALLSALRARPYNLHVIIPQLEKHLRVIECEQAIFKKLLKYWIEIEYTVKAYDELDMCKMRLSIAEKEEDVSYFCVMYYQINDIIVEQKTNLAAARDQFHIKLGRLKYFQHLERAADDMICPICHSDDKDQYAVLECGHSICLECYKLLCDYTKTNSLQCSICRHLQQNKKVHYLTRKEESSNNINMGEFSAKITYIIKLIFDLLKEDPTAKILIFSEWQPILKSIANAFDVHEIKYRLQSKPEDIDHFKNPKLGITCLLLPFMKGSKGINLIEATHVFLVEPILNPAEELQAIGRVHRIGQTKPTTVHRFIVNKTIEENIYNLVLRDDEQVQRSWNFENMKIEEIYNLFELPSQHSND